MDIYDTLAYMNLKNEDFGSIFNTSEPSAHLPSNDNNVNTPVPEPIHNNDIIILDDDDTINTPVPEPVQHKSQNKMKHIHIEDAIIKPFHNRYNKNIIQSNE